MTEFSMPWENGVGDGKIYTSSEWREAWRRMHNPHPDTDGVLFNGITPSELLTVTGGSNVFTIGAGAAMVYGGLYTNSSAVVFNAPSPVVNRKDRIVLHKSWALGTIRLKYLTGSTSVAPSLTQIPGNQWQIPLWGITLPSTITDERNYVNAQKRERFFPFEYSSTYARGQYGWLTNNGGYMNVQTVISRPTEEIAKNASSYSQLLSQIPYQVSIIYAGSYSVTGSQSVSLTHTIKSFSVGGSPTQSIVGPNTLTLTGTAGNVFSGKIDLSPSLFAFLQNGIYTIRTQRNGSSGTDTFTGFFDLVGVRVRYYSVI